MYTTYTITRINCLRYTAENYKHLLYKYTFSHLDFYSDRGNILSKILLATVDDSITYTAKELCINMISQFACKIVSPNMSHVLLDQLCIE